MQRPHSSLSKGHYNLASDYPYPQPYLVELFTRVIVSSTILAMLTPASGLCISHTLDPHPWQACSGHTCAWLILLIIKASEEFHFCRKPTLTTVSATVLCNAPITLISLPCLKIFSGQVSLISNYPMWLFHGAGALHILFTAVPSVHNTTWDTCICLTYLIIRRTVNFYIKISFKQRIFFFLMFKLWDMGMQVKESWSFICKI